MTYNYLDYDALLELYLNDGVDRDMCWEDFQKHHMRSEILNKVVRLEEKMEGIKRKRAVLYKEYAEHIRRERLFRDEDKKLDEQYRRIKSELHEYVYPSCSNCGEPSCADPRCE
jgi:hypothetical protein